MPEKKEEATEIEYEVEELPRRLRSSQGSRLALIASELRPRSFWSGDGSREGFLQRLVIRPDNCLPDLETIFLLDAIGELVPGAAKRLVLKQSVCFPFCYGWYQVWTKFILLWAAYSSFFTPMEFGFFRGLPKHLFFLDIAGQIAFLVDIPIQFLLAYRDDHTYRLVYHPASIALRYLKSGFVFDLLSCLPWDAIYKASGSRESVRYLLWVRLVRVVRVTDFFRNLEKDIRVHYLFIRIVKLIVVELYCTHTAACIFYYLATTLPESNEDQTWIGNLKLGTYSYSHFRDIDLSKRYITSLYFAIVTMATVGYGDISAVNTREMVFLIIYISFDMILGAYLIGNMTALIVKGSRTERFRDKMKDIIKYMNRNRLGKDIREQIKGHLRLKYESTCTEASVLRDIPVSIQAKISQTLYKPHIENVPLFKGCSAEFIQQIVIRLHEEFFLPGEVILQQGSAVDQLYFVCYGMLEGLGIGEEGLEETILQFEPNSSFGEIAILCNISQPYTIRVCELCRLLRLDKQSFTSILETSSLDGRTILSNLLECSESNIWTKQLESDIMFLIGKQEMELSLRVNSAAFRGDLHHLKGLLRAGADPKKTDYDGRSPLHLASSRGYEDITLFLIQEGGDINLPDKFGTTPLLEAVKHGQDRVASLLFSRGAKLGLQDAGDHLCKAVTRGDTDFIRRVISCGIDPNSKDYDHRTPLHIAAAEGLYLTAKMLIEAGASVVSMDRRGTTPLDEGRKCGNKSLMVLLENAKSNEVSIFPWHTEEIQDTKHRRRCAVFPIHPWDPKEKGKEGVMLWIPDTMEELIKSSQEQLKCLGSCLLSEDGARILDVEMVSDGQKLYLVVL